MKRIIFSFIIALTLISCNSDAFLKLERPSEYPWNTVTELEFAAVSPYNKMFYGGWGAPQSTHVLNQFLLSDYVRFLGNPEGYSTDKIYKRDFNERISEIEAFYGNMYSVIGTCNSGLDFYKSTNDNPFPYASATDKEKNIKRIKGELLFMRAYAYYHLATIFCPPYGYGNNNDMEILVKRDKLIKSAADAVNNKPVKTSEIYDLIVSDLTEAKTLLPNDWTTDMHISYKNRGRANRWAAKAFLAQVYTSMQKFDLALIELNDVIDLGGFSLTPEPFDCFNNSSTSILSTEPASKEVIFWSYFSDPIMFAKNMHNSLRLTHFNKSGRDAKNGGNGNTSTGTSPKWSNFAGWLQLVMSKNAMVEMGWMAADGTEPLSARADKRYYNPTSTSSIVNEKGLFYRFEGCYKDTTDYRIAKGLVQIGRRSGASDDGKYIISSKHNAYIGQEEPVVLVNKYFRTTQGQWQNVPMIRLAELYLNRAMIKKKLGQAGWADDYNKVASRAWNATIAGSPYVNKTDGQISERNILVERWKELAGEDSWYVQFCQAFGIEIGQGDRKTSDNTANLTAPYADKYWKNCIPLAELDFQNSNK